MIRAISHSFGKRVGAENHYANNYDFDSNTFTTKVYKGKHVLDILVNARDVSMANFNMWGNPYDSIVKESDLHAPPLKAFKEANDIQDIGKWFDSFKNKNRCKEAVLIAFNKAIDYVESSI